MKSTFWLNRIPQYHPVQRTVSSVYTFQCNIPKGEFHCWYSNPRFKLYRIINCIINTAARPWKETSKTISVLLNDSWHVEDVDASLKNDHMWSRRARYTQSFGGPRHCPLLPLASTALAVGVLEEEYDDADGLLHYPLLPHNQRFSDDASSSLNIVNITGRA